MRGLQSKLENKEQINGLKNYITMEKIEEDKTILDDVGSGNLLKDRSVLVPTCLLMEETSEQSSDTNYPCVDCDYTTNKPNPLVRHFLKIHTPMGEKLFPCESCDDKASRSNNLKRHVTKVHSNV